MLLLGVVVFAKVRSRRIRQAVLLVGSYALYVTWGIWFAAVLLTSTVMNFFLGRWLRQKPSSLILWTGILLNLALLGSFKYLPEIAGSVPLSSLESFAHLALPLGISFWTFQAMSYLLDLYRGEELDPSFAEFALYMVFFPVAISGPICRMPEMLPHRHRRLDDAVGPTAGAGDSGRRRRRDQRWFRSPHPLEWRGRLVSGVWIRIAAFLRFRWLFAHCHRRRQNAGLYPARELCASVPVHNAVDLLDALAHVTLVLDSRLCFSPLGGFAPRDVVAKLRADSFDDPVRTVA